MMEEKNAGRNSVDHQDPAGALSQEEIEREVEYLKGLKQDGYRLGRNSELVVALATQLAAVWKTLEELEGALKGLRYNRDEWPALALARDKARAFLTASEPRKPEVGGKDNHPGWAASGEND